MICLVHLFYEIMRTIHRDFVISETFSCHPWVHLRIRNSLCHKTFSWVFSLLQFSCFGAKRVNSSSISACFIGISILSQTSPNSQSFEEYLAQNHLHKCVKYLLGLGENTEALRLGSKKSYFYEAKTAESDFYFEESRNNVTLVEFTCGQNDI